MPFSSSWSLMKCIANKQTLPYWKLGVDGIMRIANMCSLPMVFFLIQILNKRALLSRNEICRKYALFWIFFDSDLTQTNAIWLRLYSDIWTKKADWGLCSVDIFFWYNSYVCMMKDYNLMNMYCFAMWIQINEMSSANEKVPRRWRELVLVVGQNLLIATLQQPVVKESDMSWSVL